MIGQDEDSPAENCHIVVVTEDRLYGELLKYGFSASGYSTTVVESGPDVKNVVAQVKPDAIVLDLFMSITDGFKLLYWLRDEYDSVIPTLVLITSEDRTLTVEVLVAGAHDVFPKPVAFPLILKSIEAIWDRNEPRTDVSFLTRTKKG